MNNRKRNKTKALHMSYKIGVFITVTDMITNEYIMPEKKPAKRVPIYG